ncbi:MAG: transport-associated protein [Acidobacteria bacterium]|nr:MAG: transport-associated protein [Acidobacteriota bacterium]
MITRFLAAGLTALWLLAAVTGPVLHSRPLEQKKPTLQSSLTESDRSQRFQSMLAAAVRHELVTLPYYDVFDWLEAGVLSDGRVVLRGEVVRPTTSDDAENRIRRIESVPEVINQIKTLSLSPRDGDLRVALYRAIYNWNSPLFRYAMRAMPPIHIIVENGRVTLKGAVASQFESQVAYTAANQVPGVFEVRNELHIDSE